MKINLSFYHPSLARLKNIVTRIHLLLTPNNERKKVFRDVPIIGFRRAKSLKDILVDIFGAALVKDLDMKFANILCLLGILHHLLQNARMRLG